MTLTTTTVQTLAERALLIVLAAFSVFLLFLRYQLIHELEAVTEELEAKELQINALEASVEAQNQMVEKLQKETEVAAERFEKAYLIAEQRNKALDTTIQQLKDVTGSTCHEAMSLVDAVIKG